MWFGPIASVGAVTSFLVTGMGRQRIAGARPEQYLGNLAGAGREVDDRTQFCTRSAYVSSSSGAASCRMLFWRSLCLI